MKIKETPITGVYILENFKSKDNRGCFKKIFNNESFKENKLETRIKEIYYSVSRERCNKGNAFSNSTIQS